ncbi:MAG TPA: AAA family ATPase, partial [Chloroflexia bacterium]|nr:AAA family ATPase [Chloroflexia bacterium]
PLPGARSGTLAMKVAVVAGPVRRFLAGRPAYGIREVLAGATLDRLAATEQQAGAGEVVLDAETAQTLAGQIAVTEWRAGHYAVLGAVTEPAAPQPWPALPAGVPTAEQARAWLLPPIYERLRTAPGEFLADLRPAVALFLRFGTLDYDGDPASGRTLDAFICHVQEILARYEGFLLQLTIGEKGSYFYAVFGAPLAHADDPLRAVAAARELQAPFPGLGPVQIGISSGRMCAGPYGSAAQRTYGVLGDEVNVAARLMAQAPPGGILVSGHVADAVDGRFRLTAQGTIPVRGRQRPVPVALVTDLAPPAAAESRVGGAGAPTALVGRAREYTWLAAQVAAVAAGAPGRLVIVAGDAGVGKSRLLAEVRREAARQGLQVLNGAGDAIEHTVPYHAWRGIFSAILGLDQIPAPAGRRAVIQAQGAADPWLARNLPLLNPVLGLDLPETPFTAALDGEARGQHTRALLLHLLATATQRAPALLILEDAHWFDSASWALALAAGTAGPGGRPPFFLLLATRPLDPPPAEYRQLLAMPQAQIFPLQPLDRHEIGELVCARLGVRALPAPVAALIAQKAEGNPFFSEELAYALRDTGLIQIVAGECRIAPGAGDLATLDFPDTIGGVITSRIDRLLPAQQLTLKVASVIGRVFALRTLDGIDPRPRDIPQLAGDLAALTQLDLTQLDSTDSDPAYLFKHIITQEVAY